MKVLVTGGAGYVGSVLAPKLLEQGHSVTVYDILMYGGNSLLPCLQHRNFNFIKGDINDTELLGSAIKDVDAVVHLAAIVGFPACRKNPRLAEEVNVAGTRSVVESMGAGQTLVYASTGSNYGRVDDVCTEESPLNPVSLYGITKTQAEEIALSHPECVALRFATAFGVSPRFRLDLLVNDFVYQAMVNKQLIVYERHFHRTFINVRDMARGIIFALENVDRMKGNAFNVGHESLNLTKEDIAKKIREVLPFYLHYAEIGHDEDLRDYEVSYEKLGSLGFSTTVSIEEGLEELMKAMRLIDVTNPMSNV